VLDVLSQAHAEYTALIWVLILVMAMNDVTLLRRHLDLATGRADSRDETYPSKGHPGEARPNHRSMREHPGHTFGRCDRDYTYQQDIVSLDTCFVAPEWTNKWCLEEVKYGREVFSYVQTEAI